MSVYLGNSDISNAFLGNTQVQYLFMGDTLVWPEGSTLPSASFGSGFSLRSLGALKANSTDNLYAFGDLTSYNGTSTLRIAKLNYDGTLVSTFSTNVNSALFGTFSSNGIYNATQTSDDKIFVMSNNGKITKINSDGTKDSTFNPGVGYAPLGFGLQPDALINSSNQIVVTLPGITSPTYKGSSVGNIHILNQSGNVVSTGYAYTSDRTGDFIFNKDIVQLASGKYFLSNVTSYNGTGITNGMVLLNSDLSRDGSYTAPFPINEIMGITQLSTGKILCQDNSDTIRRLNSDGSNDSSFTTTIIGNNTVKKVVELSDGKLLLLGNFTSVNGNTSYKQAVLLNSDGSIYTAFQTGTTAFAGGEETLYGAVPVQNRIYILGSFTSYKGVTANNIIRVNLSGDIA